MNPKDRLIQEKALIKDEIARREKRIQELTDQLEDNFGRMVLNSIMPVNSSQRHTINKTLDQTSGLFGNFFGSAGRYEPIFKILRMAASGLAWKYIRKIFK